MRVFLAGGSGVVGRALIPMLVADGHDVSATTRSAAKIELLRELGARAVPLDVFDRDAVQVAFEQVRPDAVIHQLTDLTGGDPASNAHLRRVGTRHLVGAAQRAGVRRVVAQSISWVYRPGTTPAVEDDPLDTDSAAPRRTTIAGVRALETAVLGCREGVVLRYGQLYGPGTWYARDGRFGRAARTGTLPTSATVTSFVHVDDAARAASQALTWPRGIWNIVDDEPAAGDQWVPVFADAVGASKNAAAPAVGGDIGRPVSNARARHAGFAPAYRSWREGFRME
ncbi:NAD-dependent epimerase/dehydratase family protein [Winogradskya humida]|uniref:dTDP-glucose 4,6-dehydratase n=1 Tax=Winogradskya humida TaxID=113566 RepID=A0ABQ3ZEW2_9ACTN|nr:NAD(P)-dependent oxidoreductase [Actinoplanes humidus]GIE17118.1 dTDP-glucose 4,6-dehydratase [Actinoplanes humidus]